MYQKTATSSKRYQRPHVGSSTSTQDAETGGLPGVPPETRNEFHASPDYRVIPCLKKKCYEKGEKNYEPKILYSIKLPFKSKNKVFSDRKNQVFPNRGEVILELL